MVKIAYISDPHLPPLPEFGEGERSFKRVLGYFSWHRKRKYIHKAEVLEALAKDLKAESPDHIHVGGDLTNLGLDAEYERARKWLESLGSPESVSIIPGNHDCYRKDMDAAIIKHWWPYAQGDDGEGFPYIRRIENVAIIGVSSAIPTAPFMANGRVDDNQLEKLGEILKTLGEESVCRIVSIHHPPQENACVHRRALWDAQKFRDYITKNGAELVLHGHLHKPLKAQIGQTPVYGAGSCSAVHGSYYAIEANGKGRVKLQNKTFDGAQFQ